MLPSTHFRATSSSMYRMCQPPWAKPPLESSSAPPGAWATPSRLMNSFTITFRISVSFGHWMVCRTDRATPRKSSGLLLPVPR